MAAITAAALFATLICLLSGSSAARTIGCAHNKCDLHANGAYRNLVIGRLVGVGSKADLLRVYHWAKAHGDWKSLPNSPAPYLRYTRVVYIALPPAIAKHPVAVFIQAEEYDPALFTPGALVRYSPHGTRHEAPPQSGKAGHALFHGLTGCVATLCGPHAAACASHYRQGVYTKAHGLPVNLHTGAVIPNGVGIDPISLMPRHHKKQTPQGP